MRQWIWPAFVQVMACRLFGEILIKIQKFIIHEKASENIVCEMVTTLSWDGWVKHARASDLRTIVFIGSNGFPGTELWYAIFCFRNICLSEFVIGGMCSAKRRKLLTMLLCHRPLSQAQNTLHAKKLIKVQDGGRNAELCLRTTIWIVLHSMTQ